VQTDLTIISLFVLITAIVVSFITYKVIMKKGLKREVESDVRIRMENEIALFKKSEDYKDLQKIKYLQGYESGKNDALIKYKESSEYNSIIEHEYSKGFDNGKQEALLKYKASADFEAIINNEYYKGVKEGVEKALQEYKESPEFRAIKENEYRRGEKDGEMSTLKKFEIRIDTWVDYKDSFFNSYYTDGYNLQLFFNKLPIGDPTKRVLKKKKKFKEENLKLLFNELHWAVEKYITISTGFGIPTILTSREPNRIESDIKVE
jgi:hypothetical protein